MNFVEERAEGILRPITENLNMEIVDVEYVKEGPDMYLRAYIDKEGGVTVNDCEDVSRAFEKELDKANVPDEAYILEVSSPGLTRPLKKERDYIRNQGKPVEVHTFKPIDGAKIFIGDLKSWDEENVSLDVGEASEEIVIIPKKNISVIKQYFDF